MADVNSWLERIDQVEQRLSAVAGPAGGLTTADPDTGEQWEAGQVWGHLAEFIQFWIEQAGDVIDEFQGEPVPFGRTRTDTSRLAGIEQGRHTALTLMWQEVQSDLADLREFLQALPEGWDQAVGQHPRLGQVETSRIIEEFLVGHLEEHAEQLESLRAS
ncbi:MAG TPA: hypothetical protein VIA81_05025 [Acidimicrobiia bacterium]|jgi:hypothetical protein